jgi:serine phosphatase RsbU (regulator of sigma subunit)
MPWTFSFSTKPAASRRGLQSINDFESSQTMVRAVAPASVQSLADNMLSLLLESAAGIHAAESEKALAELVLDEACRGTGLVNAALLRPLDASGTLEVVASRMPEDLEGGAMYSRSLIAAASQGVAAEISGGGGPDVMQSIVQMKIDAAICVPLMLGQTPAAYLYLDTRRGSRRIAPHRLQPNAAAFCMALGRMASLALSNLKRQEIEKRQTAMEAELSAAASVQRLILPKRECRIGAFNCIGESRPGAYVGGDFFDLIELADGKLAVALGDVTGHGIAASVLMTTAQGFLHASLKDHGDPARAANSLNEFICARTASDRFVTLWIGVFDLAAMSLTYVDAGHGYGMLLHAEGRVEPLSGGDGVPIGIMDDARYAAQAVFLAAGDRALIISDGLVEQHGPAGMFELSGVQRAITAPAAGADEVSALFAAVFNHAGSPTLSDDATAVLIRW